MYVVSDNSENQSEIHYNFELLPLCEFSPAFLNHHQSCRPFFPYMVTHEVDWQKNTPLDSRASADSTLAPHTDWHINLCATVLLLLPFQKHCEERKQTCMDGSFTFKHILVSIVNWNVSDFVTDLNVSVARAEANADSSRRESKSLKRTV